MLNNFLIEISNGGSWVNLNDSVIYKVSGDSSDTTAVQWRKIVAQSPVTEGTYLVHAVRDEVTETVHVYTYGPTQADVTANLDTLETLFGQLNFQMRITLDNTRVTWNCQASDYSIVRGQVYAHNVMAVFQASVPRLPTVTYEVI